MNHYKALYATLISSLIMCSPVKGMDRNDPLNQSSLDQGLSINPLEQSSFDMLGQSSLDQLGSKKKRPRLPTPVEFKNIEIFDNAVHELTEFRLNNLLAYQNDKRNKKATIDGINTNIKELIQVIKQISRSGQARIKSLQEVANNINYPTNPNSYKEDDIKNWINEIDAVSKTTHDELSGNLLETSSLQLDQYRQEGLQKIETAEQYTNTHWQKDSIPNQIAYILAQNWDDTIKIYILQLLWWQQKELSRKRISIKDAQSFAGRQLSNNMILISNALNGLGEKEVKTLVTEQLGNPANKDWETEKIVEPKNVEFGAKIPTITDFKGGKQFPELTYQYTLEQLPADMNNDLKQFIITQQSDITKKKLLNEKVQTNSYKIDVLAAHKNKLLTILSDPNFAQRSFMQPAPHYTKKLKPPINPSYQSKETLIRLIHDDQNKINKLIIEECDHILNSLTTQTAEQLNQKKQALEFYLTLVNQTLPELIIPDIADEKEAGIMRKAVIILKDIVASKINSVLTAIDKQLDAPKRNFNQAEEAKNVLADALKKKIETAAAEMETETELREQNRQKQQEGIIKLKKDIQEKASFVSSGEEIKNIEKEDKDVVTEEAVFASETVSSEEQTQVNLIINYLNENITNRILALTTSKDLPDAMDKLELYQELLTIYKTTEPARAIDSINKLGDLLNRNPNLMKNDSNAYTIIKQLMTHTLFYPENLVKIYTNGMQKNDLSYWNSFVNACEKISAQVDGFMIPRITIDNTAPQIPSEPDLSMQELQEGLSKMVAEGKATEQRKYRESLSMPIKPLEETITVPQAEVIIPGVVVQAPAVEQPVDSTPETKGWFARTWESIVNLGNWLTQLLSYPRQ